MMALMHRLAAGRLLAAIAALALTIGGLFAFSALPVDAFPDPSPSLVQVFTETEGLSPEEVERYVTFPIETAMSGLPKVREIRSTSNFGLSVVNIYFEDGTDVYFARQVVGERLGEAAAAIPDGFGTPVMGPISTGLGIILYFRLQDDTGQRSLVELREIADWMIKYPLQSVDGVTEVLALGGYEKQYQVTVDPDLLIAYDLQMHDVVQALEGGNRTAGAQYIEVGSEQFTVRGVGLARTVEDLAQTPVRTVDGRPVRIADIGDAHGPPVYRAYGGLRQILDGSRKPDTANGELLGANFNVLRSCGPVSTFERLNNVVHLQVIGDEQIGVHRHLILFFVTAQRQYFSDTIYRLQRILDHPVRDFAQLHQRSLTGIVLQAKVQDDSQPGRNRSHHRRAESIRNRRGGFSEALAHHLAGEIDVGAILEIDVDHRQPEVGC